MQPFPKKHRLFLILAFIFLIGNCFSQDLPPGDSLTIISYDTIRVETEGKVKRFELESKTHFPFCSKVFKIINDCQQFGAYADCCKFSTNVYETQKTIFMGTFNCDYGKSLSWMYTNSIENAKNSIESAMAQVAEQSFSFEKKRIKIFVFNQAMDGYICQVENKGRSIKYTMLYCYGSFKRYHFTLHYFHAGTLSTAEQIHPSVAEILKF